MPIYSYECSRCGKDFEVLIRTKSDSKGLSCPKCRSKKIKKTIGAISFNQNRFDEIWRKTEPERKKLMQTPVGRKLPPKVFGR